MKTFLTAIPLLTIACIQPAKQTPKGSGTQGIVVIDSDYKSTSVSLVDASGDKVAQDDCIDSGAVTPVLSTALSGDVVLPSQSQPGDALVLIDQTNSALITVDPTKCMAVHDLSVATGFYSNPHDLVGLSTTKAYVTRYGTNTMPSGKPGANDQGADLLIINPATSTITGRIDLSGEATQVTGATLQADPDRAVLANGKVYVSLDNLSADFMTTGPGRIVIVDPETDSVTGTIDPPGVKSCSQLAYLESAQELLIVCGGDLNADLATQTMQSALLVYDISGSTPTLVKTIPGTALGNRPVMNSLVAAVSDQYAIAAAWGDASGTPPDSLWNVDLKAGTAAKIADADGSFVLGTALYVAAAHRVIVTDAGMTNPHVSMYDVTNPGAPVAAGTFVADPKSGLPPRLLAWY
jgi:hypothetical protein